MLGRVVYCAGSCLFAGLLAFSAPAKAGGESLQTAIEQHYEEWQGTRHRLGGTDEKGIDCSSFIQQLFIKHFGIELPRSSREQMGLGQVIDRSNLKIGDLLFFKTGPSLRHVAVYLGDKRFLHVSSKKGVSFDNLDEKYWSKRFITARRLGTMQSVDS